LPQQAFCPRLEHREYFTRPWHGVISIWPGCAIGQNNSHAAGQALFLLFWPGQTSMLNYNSLMLKCFDTGLPSYWHAKTHVYATSKTCAAAPFNILITWKIHHPKTPLICWRVWSLSKVGGSLFYPWLYYLCGSWKPIIFGHVKLWLVWMKSFAIFFKWGGGWIYNIIVTEEPIQHFK
jgi:hypothetical protein